MAWLAAFTPQETPNMGDGLDDLDDDLFQDGKSRQAAVIATKAPAGPVAPTLASAETNSLCVNLKGGAQFVTKHVLQAMPIPARFRKDLSTLFKKFSTSTKAGGVEAVIQKNVENVTQWTLTDMKPATSYCVRVVAYNAIGSTPGAISAPMQTLDNGTGTRGRRGSKTNEADVLKAKNKAVAAATSSKKIPSPSSSPAPAAHVTKKMAKRLGGAGVAALPDATEEKKAAPKLFEAPKGPERSKIWHALNPGKLWYESRREVEENNEEKNVVVVRGTVGAELTEKSFAVMRDEEGNIIVESDEDEEEDFDATDLPDFGEFQGVMDKLRAERAEKLKEKQDAIRKAHLEKKAKEEVILAAERKKIAEEEARREKSSLRNTIDVGSTQKRLESELRFGYSFKAA